VILFRTFNTFDSIFSQLKIAELAWFTEIATDICLITFWFVKEFLVLTDTLYMPALEATLTLEYRVIFFYLIFTFVTDYYSILM
jgi:hypothetical protein